MIDTWIKVGDNNRQKWSLKNVIAEEEGERMHGAKHRRRTLHSHALSELFVAGSRTEKSHFVSFGDVFHFPTLCLDE